MNQTLPVTIMQPIKDSSQIREIGYDEDSKVLIIRFGSGTYTYDDVPADVHHKLMIAESKGKYFAAHIKNKYLTTKITVPIGERWPINVLAAG